MELVDPDFTGLFTPPEDGEYRVLVFAPAVRPASGRPARPAMTADQYRRFEDTFTLRRRSLPAFLPLAQIKQDGNLFDLCSRKFLL